MSHLSIVCLGCCIFHAPLCMQIHTTRGWETRVSHMRSEFHSFALSSALFLCLFSDHSYTIGFSFYVITSPVKNHWSFPNICFPLCEEMSLVLVHAHATPTHSKTSPAFFRIRTTCKSFNVGTFLKIESLHAPSLRQISCIPVGLIHLGCKWQVGES